MICPYCRTPIDAAPESQKTCLGCSTPHHVECFEENGGCTLFGCKFAPPDEPKVQVASIDVARAVALPGGPMQVVGPRPAFTGFGDVQAPLMMRNVAPPPAATSVAPPPPPPPPQQTTTQSPGPGLIAPLGTQLSTATAAAPAMSPATAPESSPQPSAQAGFVTPGGIFDAVADASGSFVANRRPKNRLVFILLGLGLGVFGAHNFYAGYRKNAIIQLCITVLTIFYATPVTALWALVEVCTIDRDSEHVEFD
ncbi:MAG TPA: NINE protein [Terriglobales bacterium]|nr:NINE protein [Terriglobales bacterium]